MKKAFFLSFLVAFTVIPNTFCAQESDSKANTHEERNSCDTKKAQESFWTIYQQRSDARAFFVGFWATQLSMFTVGTIVAVLTQCACHSVPITKFISVVGGGTTAIIAHNTITPSVAENRWEQFIIDAATRLNMSQANQAFNVNIKDTLDANQLSINAATTAAKKRELSISKWGSRTALFVNGIALLGYIIYKSQ